MLKELFKKNKFNYGKTLWTQNAVNIAWKEYKKLKEKGNKK